MILMEDGSLIPLLGDAREPFNSKNSQNTIEDGNFSSKLLKLKSALESLKKAVENELEQN
ncbi:hypothetical protein [Borreliella tanukii]|uniref:hypothetical protein n=1 Tax=Borreliella tanukii TaxID=56146 RepID=UPI003CC90FA6